MVGFELGRKVNPLAMTGSLAGLLVLGLAGWLNARPGPQSSPSSSSTQSQPAQQSQQGQQAQPAKKSPANKPQAEKAAPPAAQPSAPRRVYSNGTGTYYEAPPSSQAGQAGQPAQPAANSSAASPTSSIPSSAPAPEERRMVRYWQASPAVPATQAGAAAAPGSKTDGTAAQTAQPAQPQTAGQQSGPQSSARTYSYSDGTNTYYQTVDSTRKPTANGNVVTQQAHASDQPGQEADNEVITKNLPDGTVETDTIIKGDDGSGHEVPVGMLRQLVKKVGDKTTIEQDTMRSDGEGHWYPSQKEQTTETGTDKDGKTVKQILQPDLDGSFKVVDSEQTVTKTGKDGVTDAHTVRQTPDAYGRLADYEIKDERTTAAKDGKETHEVTLKRRDSSETDHPNFFLVNKTVETQTTSADGKTITKHSTTESAQLPDSSYQDVESYQPRVVEESTSVTTKDAKGGEKTVTEVKQRDVADPNNLKPAYKVVKQTDKDGNVRQVYIPSQP